VCEFKCMCWLIKCELIVLYYVHSADVLNVADGFKMTVCIIVHVEFASLHCMIITLLVKPYPETYVTEHFECCSY